MSAEILRTQDKNVAMLRNSAKLQESSSKNAQALTQQLADEKQLRQENGILRNSLAQQQHAKSLLSSELGNMSAEILRTQDENVAMLKNSAQLRESSSKNAQALTQQLA